MYTIVNYMSDVTTIQVNKKLVKSLKDLKEYPRETYEEILEKMIKTYKSVKQRNQYDKFLHKIQQAKMKELWENKEDDVWENV